MENKEELKPCPFCPSDDCSVLLIGGLLNPQCNACKSSCGLFNTEAEAISAWNHRQGDTGFVEELEKIMKTYHDADMSVAAQLDTIGKVASKALNVHVEVKNASHRPTPNIPRNPC